MFLSSDNLPLIPLTLLKSPNRVSANVVLLYHGICLCGCRQTGVQIIVDSLNQEY